MPRLPTFLCAALLAALTARGQTVGAPAAPSPPPTESSPFFSRLSGLFSNDLPELDRPDAIKLVLRPHFGDLIHRDYLRLDTGLRWALSDHFEVRAEVDTFFPHGLKGSTGYGIGQLNGGAKYVFRDWPWRAYETSFDLNLISPVGHPPVDMTDGFRHTRPSFVIQHLTERNPRLTLFGGLGLDLVQKTSIPGTPGANEPHDNSLLLTAGGVYDAGQIKWTLASGYATTALIGERTHQFVYLQPGLLWYVPSRFTFHSRTQWIVGLGINTSWGPDGFAFSAGSKLRAEITFRQVMDTLRGKSPGW